MSGFAVVVPLKRGAADDARRLLADGPPFPLERTPLHEHRVYLTEREAVFVFDGPKARAAVEEVLGDAGVWQAAHEWRALLADKPRVAEVAFAWERGEAEPLHLPGL